MTLADDLHCSQKRQEGEAIGDERQETRDEKRENEIRLDTTIQDKTIPASGQV